METNVLVVDDHPLLRKGIIDLLTSHFPQWKIHQASDGLDAVRKAKELHPELIFMDYRMPKMDGLKASSIIMEQLPKTKIIMVSMEEGTEYVRDAFDANVCGIVTKTYSEVELIDAITTVRNGKIYLNKNDKEILVEYLAEKNRRRIEGRHQVSPVLTDREIEVIRYIVLGKTAKEIAELLSISSRTVETHKTNILSKCQVKTTAELVRYAISKKLVSL